jgi:hypothetical protein
MDFQHEQRRRVAEPRGADEAVRRPTAPAAPAARQPASPRQRIRQQLATPQRLRETILLAEIIGPPKGLR